ncbi:LolA family protein [Oceanibaculum indicum]|uniref:LolA family protein n=1 Tax=Oceanibaculum indicum TaxID=526216 RepID=UPI0015FFB59B|nr:outer membrane lipoprotein carrier protein LolA [Oceanibaculum indicum]
MAASLSAADRETIERLETYLNNIKTMQADFQQIASTGQSARGIFYLSRPGKLRVQYTEPEPAFLLANQTLLVYVDEKLGQESYVPTGSTPVSFLLADTIRLDGDVRIERVQAKDNVIRVALVQRDDPDAGSLSLVFTDLPLELRQWTVTDAQGVKTTIALNNTSYGRKLDPDLFEHRQKSVQSPRN